MSKPASRKSKTSRAQKVINLLKITSPAKGALLFVLAFGIIGGAVMAYRSLAASYSIVNQPSKISLVGSSQGVKQTDSHGGKPNTIIWRIEKNATVTTTFSVPALSSSVNADFCVNYRFTVPTTNDHFAIRGATFPIVETGSNTYSSACLGKANIKLTPGVYNPIQETVTNKGPGDMYIANMYIRWTSDPAFASN